MQTTLALSLAIFLLFQNGSAAAATPEGQVRKTIDEILVILKDPQLKAKPDERRRKLEEAIEPRFDFLEMAKRSLGPEWRRMTPEQQREFVALFTELLKEAYLSRIESYNSERVEYLKERTDGEYAEVHTRIIDSVGRDFSVNYHLHNLNGDWKVYDVVVEHVSLVNNYRSQFSRVLARSSFDDLLRRMKDKTFSSTLAKG